jgi:signal peptidase II
MNRTIIFGLITSIVILIDQYTKYIVRHNFIEGKSVKLLNNVVYLTYVKNQGAAFGMLQGGRWIFVAIALIVIVFMLLSIKFIVANNVLLIGSSLLMGGIIGNAIDRVFLGFVTDFIDFRFWPVFNVADSAVDIGLGIIVLYFVLYEKNIKS